MNNNQNKKDSSECRANDRVRQYVKRIVECMGLRYIFASMYEANVLVGEGDFPVVVDVLPTSGSVSVR